MHQLNPFPSIECCRPLPMGVIGLLASFGTFRQTVTENSFLRLELISLSFYRCVHESTVGLLIAYDGGSSMHTSTGFTCVCVCPAAEVKGCVQHETSLYSEQFIPSVQRKESASRYVFPGGFIPRFPEINNFARNSMQLFCMCFYCLFSDIYIVSVIWQRLPFGDSENILSGYSTELNGH